jgi:hypothetical protein
MKDLLTSRKFWALVIGLLVLFTAHFFPNFQLDEEATIGLVVVVASYVVGTAIDPGPGGWRGVVQSRKFWAALVGLAAIFMKAFGAAWPEQLPQDTVIWLAVLVGTYISGVAIESFTKSPFPR